MLYEAALIWVLLSGGYWGYHLLTRRAYPSSIFPWMMIAAAAASGLGLVGRGQEDPVLSIAGAIGLGAGVCLLVLGPAARRLARQANTWERWGLARVCYELAEVLQPATGVREEKHLAAAFSRIQAGQSDEAVQALVRLRDGSPPGARRMLNEHIAMIYLTACRWRDALTHVEATLFEPATAADSPPRVPLHDISPSLWVELMGAYGRVGELERAGGMLEALEAELGARAAAAPLLHRARMIYLAYCGRVDAVATLTKREHSSFMTRSARRYWLGVAAGRAGDRALATHELRQSAVAARGRRRRMAETALAELDSEPPVEVSPRAASLADHVAALPVPVFRPIPRPWFTWIACGACLAVAGGIALVGSSTDISMLVRAGALVQGLVSEGQWWRLATAVLLHVGATHLAVNVLSLWVIGRLAEGVFGTLRTAALFAGCGLAGSLASHLGGPPGVAAGASGAILGLLGALLTELAMNRQRLAYARRSGLLGSMLLVVAATFAIGALVPGIDQWAHGAGLLCGVALGQALTPRHRLGRALGPSAGLLVAAFVGLLAWGAWGAARLTFVDSALSGAPKLVQLGELEVEVPGRWQLVEGELVDPDFFVVLTARFEPAARAAPGAPGRVRPAPSEALAQWHAGEPARARARELDTVGTSAPSQLALPAGWYSRELALSASDPFAGTQHFRAVSFVRPTEEGWIVGTLYAPQSLVDEGAAELAAIVATVRLQP